MKKKYLVCIDSDGSVFDSMTFKHRECLTQVFIEHFSLQSIEPIARETWEYVNLYSRTRGCNRFLALLETLFLLRQRLENTTTRLELPHLEGLSRWVTESKKLSNSELALEYSRTNDPDLGSALAWSKKGSAQMDGIMRNGIPPFNLVVPALESISQKADIIIISQGPTERIAHEWRSHGLEKWPRKIIGHEFGSKSTIIKDTIQSGYTQRNVLIIGDSPCDALAAKENDAFFFPIVPGAENESWKYLLEKGINCFFSGRFLNDSYHEQMKKFDAALLVSPPWCK